MDNTLFFLLIAMLTYRTIDLLTIRQKLEQLASRVSRDVQWNAPTIVRMRSVRRLCRDESRTFLVYYKVMNKIRLEFVSLLMGLYLFIFAVVGFSLLSSVSVKNGKEGNLVVAVVTALVSLLASLLNLALEFVRSMYERKGSLTS